MKSLSLGNYTQTGTCMHFNSHHPVNAKRAAVRSLLDRARNVTIRKENQWEELLTASFKHKGYSLHFIHDISSSIQELSALSEEPDKKSDDNRSQEKERNQPLADVSGVSE